MSRLSNSSLSLYLRCPRAYKHRYIDRMVSKYKSSALYFGTALDMALNELLLGGKSNLEKAKKSFEQHWTTQKDNVGNEVFLPGDPNVLYYAADFDAELLTDLDFQGIESFAKELGIESDPFLIRETVIANRKEMAWGDIDESHRRLHNYMNWVSLSNKAMYMLEAYAEEVLPRLDKVLFIQKEVNLGNKDGDNIVGFIDYGAKFDNVNANVLVDNKTSSAPYKQDSVRTSQQLALYKVMLNEQAPEANITKCAYVVLNKKLNRIVTKTCQSCGYVAEEGTSHKKCNNPIKKKRCNGEWAFSPPVFKAKVQVIIDNISPEMEDSVLESFNEVNHCIKQESFDQNWKSCYAFGTKCDYYNLCHNQDPSELVDLPPKEDKK